MVEHKRISSTSSEISLNSDSKSVADVLNLECHWYLHLFLSKHDEISHNLLVQTKLFYQTK